MKAAWCCRLLGTLAVVCFIQETSAQPEPSGGFPTPFAISNQSPVVAIFGIPKAQGTTLVRRGKTEWDATVEQTSHFNETFGANEDIVLDGETTRFALRFRYGLNDHWNIGVEIPWVRHSGGVLDGFIVDWHHLWGFPQNGRDVAPEDRLLFRYRRGDQTLLNLDSPTEGIGDVIVSAQRLLHQGTGERMVLHTQVKLPTGEAGKLTGSGAADAGAGVELSKRWRRRWHSNFRAGLVYLGDGDVLPGLRRNFAAYGGFNVVWRPVRAVSFSVQYDAHTAPYRDTDLDELGLWSGMLTAGGTVHLSRNTALDLAVVENVPNARSVSDVSFHVRLRAIWGDRP